jgi:amino acid adenylation domain-containing protein
MNITAFQTDNWTMPVLLKTGNHAKEPMPAGREITFHPLSYNQRSLWHLYQLAPESDAYNIWFAARIGSPVDVAALQRAFQTLVDHHPILRTTYTLQGGEPVQQIHDQQTVDFGQIDAAGWDEEQLKQQVAWVARQPFDLEHESSMRVRLFTRTATDHVLLMNYHHIAADLITMVMLVEQLGESYGAIQSNAQPPAPQPEGQPYTDYVAWQREMLVSEGEQLQAYWQQALAGELPALDLPTDQPVPSVQRYVGASEPIRLAEGLLQQLRDLADAEAVPLFTLLLAAFQILLQRYTGQDEILVGTAVSARQGGQFHDMAGYFINPLVIRTVATDNPGFRTLLQQVSQRVRAALDHRRYPFPLLVEQLVQQRDPSRPPLFQAALNMMSPLFHRGWANFFLPEEQPVSVDLGGLALQPFFLPMQEGADFLLLDLWETEDAVRGFLKYNTDLFDAATIRRLAGHFQTLLAGIVADPDQPIGQLPLLAAGEQHQLLVEWNDTAALYPHDRCFHHLFEELAVRTPDAVAVVFAERQLTYCELNSRANQLAHYLHKLGVGPETLVGLCTERSPELIIGLLGILKAGGAYLPLDPGYPQERLAWMLEDAQPLAVVTQEHLCPALPLSTTTAQPCHIVCLDSDGQTIASESEENPAGAVDPDTLAYVIYTSGSTGRPKGVLVPHRGLCNVVAAQIQTFRLRPTDRVLQHLSLNFDGALSEITLALGAGATLCLLPGKQLAFDAEFVRLLRNLRITAMFITPSALAVLPAADLPDLHTLGVAGEACPAELVARWGQGRRFFNLYGPTENTIWATVAECQADGFPPPIGRPIQNVQLYVLDCYRQPVPVGVPGELYIGGVGVTRGYLDRPELTAERFIPNPFGEGRLYKTGDRVRYRPVPEGGRPLGANLEFLGRIDQQVKVRGFRIELGEIERTLLEHPQVQECAVIVREERPGEKQLVAYVVCRPQFPTNGHHALNGAGGETELVSVLRRFLQGKLPTYMVPSALVPLMALPLTPNGKLDRRALPAPMHGRNPTGAPTQSPTEERLASLWASVLGVAGVGRQDNFFDLGGHSLSATQLIYRVQESFGVTLSVRRLYEVPTVAAMAQEINRLSDPLTAPAAPERPSRPAPAHSSCLIPLQSEGSQPPFFCVHPIAGVVFPYYDLALALGADQPVYGLQAAGLGAGERPLTSIEAMAEQYLAAVRTVQPHGPYLLGGWSFGVHVAYEMAQQLQRAGERVALLALIDTPPASTMSLDDLLHFTVTAALPSIWPYLFDYFQLLARRSSLSARGTDGQEAPSASLLRKWLGVANGRGAWLAAWRQLPEALRIVRVMRANTQAQFDYAPQPYPGRLTLLRTGQAYGASGNSPDLGWRALAQGDVEVYRVPGHHLNLLRRPYVRTLAGQLRSCIDTVVNPAVNPAVNPQTVAESRG